MEEKLAQNLERSATALELQAAQLRAAAAQLRENPGLPKLLTVKDAADYSGISEFLVRKAVKTGQLQSAKVGSALFVVTASLDRLYGCGDDGRA